MGLLNAFEERIIVSVTRHARFLVRMVLEDLFAVCYGISGHIIAKWISVRTSDLYLILRGIVAEF